jgi:choline kinase
VIGLVLAAGASRRLRPVTDDIPKTLVPVDGERTILDISLGNIAAAGLDEAVVIVGYAAHAIESRLPDLSACYGLAISLVHNERAEEWNNAYSLWLAREHYRDGALLLNGDTVHPASVEKTLLGARGPGVLIAVDDEKTLGEEEMKVTVDPVGGLTRITKQMEPAAAYAEYIGVTLIEPYGAEPLTEALEATWRRDPNLYYEDGFQELVDRGGDVVVAPIGTVTWVEVDDHADLARAREIACLC